jgi:hypothetical protein
MTKNLPDSISSISHAPIVISLFDKRVYWNLAVARREAVGGSANAKFITFFWLNSLSEI